MEALVSNGKNLCEYLVLLGSLSYSILSFHQSELISSLTENVSAQIECILIYIGSITSAYTYFNFFVLVNRKKEEYKVSKWVFFALLYQFITLLLICCYKCDSKMNLSICKVCFIVEFVGSFLLSRIISFINSKKIITIRLPQAIKKVQEIIYRKSIMGKFEEKFSRLTLSGLEKSFEEVLKQMKKHYTTISLSLEYNSTGNVSNVTKNFFEYNFDSSQHEDKSYTEFVGGSTFQCILDEFKRNNDKSMVDKLTFGFFASYYSFLTTEKGISDFLNTIKNLNDDFDKICSFSRIAFFSPFFLKFISKVFSQFSLYDIESVPINQMKEIIKSSWRKNSNLIPKFISDLLSCSSNPEKLLSKCFFEVAFNNNNLEMYKILCIFEYYNLPKLKVLENLRKLLIFEERENILNELVESCKNNKSNYVYLPKDIQGKNSKLNTILLSSFDIEEIKNLNLNLITLFKKMISKKAPTDYTTCFYLKEDLEDISNTSYSGQILNSSEHNSILRYLVQTADTIPYFNEEKIDDLHLSIEEFLNEYLVLHGEMKYIDIKMDIIDILRKDNCLYNESYIISCFEKIYESENNNSKTNLKEICTDIKANYNINVLKSYILDMFERVGNSFLYVIFLKENKSSKSPSNIDYNQNNKEFRKCYANDIRQKSKLGYMNLPIFYFNELIKNVTFVEYKIEDTNMNIFIKNYCSTHYEDKISGNEKYKEIIKNVKKNNEIKAIFIYAFYYYTHPLKKVSLVKKGLLLIDKLIKNVIKDPVVAADDYTPIYIQALCDINPYGIKSNWEFFNKYVIGVLDDFVY